MVSTLRSKPIFLRSACAATPTSGSTTASTCQVVASGCPSFMRMPLGPIFQPASSRSAAAFFGS